jgi:hypothetical protein
VSIRFRFAVLVFLSSFSLIGCSMEEEAADQAKPKGPETKREQPPKPTTPEDFLDRAEEAMRKEPGWAFAVKGEETLGLQGQESTASYQAAVKRTQEPEALHSQGTITRKGKRESEEIFVIGDTVHVKEGEEGWKQGPVSDPEMKNKVEDPMAAIEAFRRYRKETADDVTLTEEGGEARLRVRASSVKLPEGQNRAFVKKAVEELDPTLEQLRKAGVAVNTSQLTLSRLEETLVLDAETHQIKSHRLQFRFLIPYGSQNITYEQSVDEEIEGTFDGAIKLPESIM